MKKYFSHPDVAIQTLLLFPMLLCYLSFVGIIFGLLLQLAIGGYQLLSGVYYAFGKNSAPHQLYLKRVLIYALVMAGFFFLVFVVEHVAGTVFFIGMSVVAVVFAIWYYTISLEYHNKAIQAAPLGNDDVLDDQLFL